MLLLDTRAASAQGGVQFPKGTLGLDGIVGTALPVTWLRQHSDRRITFMISVDAGRVMTNQIGPGPLAGQFEFLFEITPVMTLRQPEHAFGVNASPLHMRWNFAPRRSGRLRGFAEASGGVVYTNQAVPVHATAFNFIDQAGFGLRVKAGDKRNWVVGYRFQHISNGGRVEPNPGANFNFVYVGMGMMGRP